MLANGASDGNAMTDGNAETDGDEPQAIVVLDDASVRVTLTRTESGSIT